MFRRSKTSTPAAESVPTTTEVGGKGRPTPSRKEAEAAARARAKASAKGARTRKEQLAQRRLANSGGSTASSAQIRQAMRTGDERYLPARDQGPVKRFTRDFVDSRFSFIELMIPVLLLTTAMAWTGNQQLATYGNAVLMGMLLLIIFDMFRLRGRLKKELATRFPDDTTPGVGRYAVMRALQMKFMRLPKAQVKIGQALPEQYR